jgi:hypothetical protein
MTTMILRHMHLSKSEQENLEGKAYKSRIVEPILSFESVLLRSAGDPDPFPREFLVRFQYLEDPRLLPKGHPCCLVADPWVIHVQLTLLCETLGHVPRIDEPNQWQGRRGRQRSSRREDLSWQW